MAINLTTLTREWIQFLKNNQIVGMQSDPKSGKLNYKRKPNVQELIRFLDIKTDFDEEDVRAAVKTVLKSKGGSDQEDPKALPGPGPGNDVSTWSHSETTPADAPDNAHREPLDSPAKAKKYSNDDAEDIDYRDPEQSPGEPPALTHKRKPRFKYRAGQDPERLSEDFYDRQGVELEENDVKQIFRILLSPKPQAAEPAEPEPTDDEKTAKKQEETRKIKRIIRDSMNAGQRKALWRLLDEMTNLSESQISPADAKAVLSAAAELKNKPTGLGKVFKGLRKDKIDVNDLQQAWKDAGFPDDTRDLHAILKNQGFGDNEINKVFSTVFGGEEDKPDQPMGTQAVQKIAEYAQRAGIVDELKSFMAQEFGEELGIAQPKKRGWFGRKAVTEEVREIFTKIVQEERTDRLQLIKQQEQTNLGRTRK